MKRIAVYLGTLICMMLVFTAFTFSAADSYQNDGTTELFPHNQNIRIAKEKESAGIKLPSSLMIIEDSAFEGVAVSKVELPESVEEIGNNAFANIKILRFIHIPNKATIIGRDAFNGSNQVMIIGAARGNAQNWAQGNGIPFIPDHSSEIRYTAVQTTGLFHAAEKLRKPDSDETVTPGNIHQLSGRITTDLHSTRFTGITAFHIQGRSPPLG